MSRKYRIDANGQERPVWASKSELVALGTIEGAVAYFEGRQPIRFGNTIHDNAAQKEFDRLTNLHKKA